METKVTEVEIIPVRPKGGLVAVANCVIDDKMYLGSIGIQTRIKGDYGGFRLLWPTRKVGDRELNVYHPIRRDVYQIIEKAVIGEYEKMMRGNYDDLKQAEDKITK